MPCCGCHLSRREFLELSGAGMASLGLFYPGSTFAGKPIENWDPERPFLTIGRKIVVQPILMYTVSHSQAQRSYKSWGGIQTEQSADEETARIRGELETMQKEADFPLQIQPVIKVDNVEKAVELHQRDFDVLVIFAARGGGDLLRACFSKTKDNIVFVRHRSGPVYYWYEALSVRYLQRQGELNDEKPAHVDDVVVDDYSELLWRLCSLFGIKNFLGSRIVALGGAWGKYSAEAPQIARERFKLEIIESGYDDLAKRIVSARKDRSLLTKAREWTDRYLSTKGTTLKTNKIFVENAFVLYWIFKELMREHESHAFTIKDCMATVMPMSETTACLTLGLLNDEGLLAFCESDFVIIPPGILLRFLSGKPVFLHNSTFPHKGEVTCAHCIGPRRMDGVNYEPAEIMTHYESEYGAAPKVTIPIGQQVTFLNPEYSTGRWLGFKGIVKRNPYYEICRSQQDVEILGDWKKLLNEVRDSHWVMVYGDYLKESGYAARKLGLQWENFSENA